MQVTEAATAPVNDGDSGKREGVLASKLMLAGKEGSPNNYKVSFSQADTDWLTPRHHHNFDQVRFPISGEFVYADHKVLPAGWVGYFPEGAYYGPQIRKQGLRMVVFQFGGASGQGHLTKRQRTQAFAELVKKGKFEKGTFAYVDADGKTQSQDGFEAVWEQAMGRKLHYPKPRYNDIIAINPENFEWVKSAEFPGVSFKWLGTFSERETRIGLVRLDAGAKIDFGKYPAPELLFLSKGSVHHNGRTYGLHTAIAFETLEGETPITAVEPSEFFLVQLPKF